MTNIYVDCEFNGFGGQLISMALISDDGREWYEVLPLPSDPELWVSVNVLPVLARTPMMNAWDFRRSLHRFLRQFDKPHFVADWYTDLMWLFAQFAGRDHSESITLPCTAEIKDCEYVSAVPHNALHDARAIREALTCQSSLS